MDRGLKERLVGAAVLIALGVWLIPLVLDGPDPDAVNETAALTLPAASEPAPVRTRTIPLDAPDTSLAEAVREPVATAEAPVPAAESPPSQAEAATRAEAQTTPSPATATDDAGAARAAASPSEPEPAVAQTSPPSAVSPTTSQAAAPVVAGDWLVQLGSFGQEENARRLAERVAGYGHSPDISTHRAGGRTMHRVRIGPYQTRESAEAVVSSLAAHGFVAQVVMADGATP
jgi:DedD protein